MLTIFLVEITIQATSFIQGLFIGHYLDTEEFSAYGLACNYINFQYIIGSMFAAGTQITVATFLSAGKKKEAQGAFLISVITVICLGILVIILVNIFADEICIFFGARGNAEHLLPQVREYLKLIVLSCPAYCLSFVLPQVALLQGGHKFVYSSYASMLILTFAGCIVNFEVIQGGLNGLGMLYSFNYYVAVLILVVHYLNKNNTFNFYPQKIKLSLIKPVLKQAMPDMTLGICLLIFPIVLNGIILQYDDAVHGLAAFSMQMNFRNFITTISTGICTAVLVLFGIFSSQRDYKECRKVINYSLQMFLFIIIPLSIIIAIFSGDIAYLYTQNEETIGLAKIAIIWISIYLPFFSIFRVCVKILQAVKHSVSPIVLNILGYLILPVALGFILSAMFGITGVLMALPVAQVIQCIFSLGALLFDHCFHKGKNEITVKKCVRTKDNPILHIKPEDMNDINKQAEKIFDFCDKHNIYEFTKKKDLYVLRRSLLCNISLPAKSKEKYSWYKNY